MSSDQFLLYSSTHLLSEKNIPENTKLWNRTNQYNGQTITIDPPPTTRTKYGVTSSYFEPQTSHAGLVCLNQVLAVFFSLKILTKYQLWILQQ